MDMEQRQDQPPLSQERTPQEPSKPKKTANPWRTSTIALAILAVGLAVALVYAFMQLQLAQNNVRDLTTQRDSAREQLETALEGNQTADTSTEEETDAPTTEFTSEKGVKVIVTSPASDSTSLSSPLAIRGKVPGNWSQEGQFGVLLRNSAGTTVASGTATLSGDWMTENLVDFTASLTWTGTLTGTHTLVLEKANPSDLAANADSVEIEFKLN